jgi:hypothetical protein
MTYDYLTAMKDLGICFAGAYLGIYLGNKVCNKLTPIIKEAAHRALFDHVTRIDKKQNKLEKVLNE